MRSQENPERTNDFRNLLADLLARRDQGEPLDLEQIRRQWPDHAASLTKMWEDLVLVRGVLDRMSSPHLEVPANETAICEVSDQDSYQALIRRLESRHPGPSRYQVRGEIARGGMGVILRVWDEDLHRTMAMKLLRTDDVEGFESGKRPVTGRKVQRFLEEAQVTSQLDHPGILPVYELGVDSEGRTYYTMPLVKGHDLKEVFDRVRQGREGWSLTGAIRVIIKVCEAVAYAHAKDVIHRDLKPSNIMVGRFGQTYVMDWGLARVIGRTDSRDVPVPQNAGSSVMVQTERQTEARNSPGSPLHTRDGDVLGTPSYMPPEQAQGLVEYVGKSADVYSIGAMLYHLLTGQMPYVEHGSTPSPRYVLSMVVQGPPKSILEIVPTAPPELVAICNKAMRRDPDSRYSDCMTMARDLEAYLENRPITALAPKLGYLLRLACLRHRPVMVTAAAALVILTTFVAIFIANLSHAVREKQAALVESERMNAVLSARALMREIETLYPLTPDLAPTIESWLHRTDDLLKTVDSAGLNLAEPVRFLDLAGEQIAEEDARDFLENVKTLRLERPRIERNFGIARNLGRTTLEDVNKLWQDSIDDVAATDLYEGLELVPQLGLVPFQKSPVSGIWEFWYVLSGTRPEIEPVTGKVLTTPESGMILVLIPGGAFLMGSPEEEARRDPNERQHKVTLRPFFLARHEVTQAQWARIMESNPSGTLAGTVDRGQSITTLNPVENVSWHDCERFLQRLDLCFPTEAQWEYACRAGTQTAFSWGDDDRTLQGRDNVRDRRLFGAPGLESSVFWDDGFYYHAPVGSFQANPFGLFDMHGNVTEWCADDAVLDYPVDSEIPGDGLNRSGELRRKVFRGGSWYLPPEYCRSAFRHFDFPNSANQNHGLRVARDVRP